MKLDYKTREHRKFPSWAITLVVIFFVLAWMFAAIDAALGLSAATASMP